MKEIALLAIILFGSAEPVAAAESTESIAPVDAGIPWCAGHVRCSIYDKDDKLAGMPVEMNDRGDMTGRVHGCGKKICGVPRGGSEAGNMPVERGYMWLDRSKKA